MKRRFFAAGLLAAGLAIGAAAQSTDLASEGRRWWAHVQFLADDALEGRNVGTPGFDKALEYVEGQFRAIGLKPAGTTGFRQPVGLESRQLVVEQSRLALVRDGREVPLVRGQDASLSARGELNGSLDAGMVFVGHGLSIPEAGWDDFAGLDLTGKIAVYVNAFPAVDVSDNVRSHVNNATERWLALKRAGAIGVATIASGGGGRGGGAAPIVALTDPDVNDLAGQMVSVSFTARGAAAILDGSGHSLDEIARLLAANQPLPRFALPGTLRARAVLTRDPIASANLVGVFEGSDPALRSEYVVMSAHLDHVGIGRDVNGDNLYNGAMDNASGVAAVIETARLLQASGVRTKRSVLFLAVTAEERGLLGSRHFAGRPTVPAGQIVANINLDMFLPLYPLKVIEVQGLAESSLGDSVRAAARTLGVDVQTDREPEQNRFIRSDQYSFIRRGVPALAFKFGYEFGSPEETTRLNWVRDVYHRPSDDATQPVDLEAAATFNRVIMTLLQRVANDDARPTWNADSFFKRFAAADTGQEAARLDAVVRPFTENGRFMGSVLVARGDEAVLSKGYGKANIEWDVPNDHSTKFRIGSITKQFTAALILLLEQEGKLSIQDRISRHVPNAPAAWKDITLFHLLTHTSGIANFTALPDYRVRQVQPATPADQLERLRDEPLDFEPGSNYRYSNSGYLMLGHVIELVTGRPYAEVLQERILGPVGMTSSGYDSNAAILPNRASGYAPGPDGPRNAPFVHMTVPHAAGALYSTTGDLHRWMRALFGGRVLSADSLRKMTTVNRNNYGLGLTVRDADGRRLIGHGGSINGFNAFAGYYPDAEVTVVVLANVAGNTQQIAMALGSSLGARR